MAGATENALVLKKDLEEGYCCLVSGLSVPFNGRIASRSYWHSGSNVRADACCSTQQGSCTLHNHIIPFAE